MPSVGGRAGARVERAAAAEVGRVADRRGCRGSALCERGGAADGVGSNVTQP